VIGAGLNLQVNSPFQYKEGLSLLEMAMKAALEAILEGQEFGTVHGDVREPDLFAPNFGDMDVAFKVFYVHSINFSGFFK
jgi:hypothetical protein